MNTNDNSGHEDDIYNDKTEFVLKPVDMNENTKNDLVMVQSLKKNNIAL